ncbi:MOSC domain-containing protein [Hypomontagnella monticulosa]|nr:MOSC domain-containing protein [Hypomontagnella monticulosa]
MGQKKIKITEVSQLQPFLLQKRSPAFFIHRALLYPSYLLTHLPLQKLYIYPIKSLRPLSVTTAQLRREGLRYDRRFMLLKVEADGGYKNIQTAYFPECTLFHQAIDGDHVVVTYQIPEKPLVNPPTPEQSTALRVPLNPAIDGLETVDIKLFGSSTTTYRMGDPYDTWFSSCFGYPAILVYIGDNRRPVLAHSPRQDRPQQSWFSSVTSVLSSYLQQPQGKDDEASGLAFNEAAPFLITSKASLRDVSARLPEGETMDMIKFRPNIVVDEIDDDDNNDDSDELEEPLNAWDEDFWAELLVNSQHRLALTANCARCISINIDYGTGRPALGEQGAVLKKLMRDRRVDAGNKWSPIFGRYAFLLPPTSLLLTTTTNRERGKGEDLVADVAVGDEVKVTRRISDRDVWAWPK